MRLPASLRSPGPIKRGDLDPASSFLWVFTPSSMKMNLKSPCWAWLSSQPLSEEGRSIRSSVTWQVQRQCRLQETESKHTQQKQREEEEELVRKTKKRWQKCGSQWCECRVGSSSGG